MRVLLLPPVPRNERFGLGPFFRMEPLGIEYIAAALEARGDHVRLADLRFSGSLTSEIRQARPGRDAHERYRKDAGSTVAFGTTSSNAISLVSPFGNVIRIAVISSDVRSIHKSRLASPSLICFRVGTITR